MSASSLEVVLSWLMEYALKYDMEKLRKELIRLFPKHCSQKVIEKLSIPDELHLTTLCHLRGFRNGQTVLIDNLDDLINLIEYFQKVKMAIDTRPFKSSRLLSKVEPDYLVAFLDQLELLRDLLDLKSRMEFLSHDYKKDFFDDGENEYDRYIHNGLITFQVSDSFQAEDVDYERARKVKFQRFIQLMKIEKRVLKTDELKKEIDSLKKKIIQNEFIDVYEKDLLKNVLDKPTLLERSILDLEESHDCENEDREIQLLNQHLSGKMVAMKDDKTEKILLNFTQELSKLLEQKKPKWCPVIYLENSITGGLDAIKIKNAYD